MPSLKDIVEAMSASWPAALAILLASLAILVSDYFELRYVAMLPQWSLGTAFVAAVASGSVLVVAVVRGIGNLAMKPIWRRRFEKIKAEDIAKLEDLPDPEVALLIWAVANRTQVFTAPYFNPHVKALLAKGLVSMPGGSHRSDEVPLTIPDHVWAALKAEAKNQDLSQLVGVRPFDRW